LGEQLDAQRKARQALYPELTLTGMYNVMEKLRALDRQADTRTESGVEPPTVQSLASRPARYDTESQRQRDSLDCLRLDAALPDPSGAASALALTPKERQIHELGLVTVLRELHDELDRAVLDAYGWPHDLDGQALLQRLVDLNAARAAEEEAGLVRWLRPEYQNPGGTSAQTGDLGLVMPAASATPGAPQGKRPWPKAMAERVQVLRAVLAAESVPVTVANLAARFSRAPVADLTELLDTLVLLGHVRRLDDGRCEACR
jgi:hypothetical protein